MNVALLLNDKAFGLLLASLHVTKADKEALIAAAEHPMATLTTQHEYARRILTVRRALELPESGDTR